MVERILTFLFATYADILSSKRSTAAHAFRFIAIGMLPYQWIVPKDNPVRDFGTMLSPGKFSVPSSLTSELLRFL